MVLGSFWNDKKNWTRGRIVCRHHFPARFLHEEERVGLTLTLFTLPGVTSASFDFPPPYRTERGTSLIRQGIGNQSFVSDSSGRLPRCPIQERTGIGTSVSTDAPDFECPSIIKMGIARATNDGDAAYHSRFIGHREG